MSLEEDRDEAVDKIREELNRLIHDSGETQRTVERRNGFKTGYLSQVLHGHITLTARHVVGILFALDEPPASFFARLFEPGPASEFDEIRQRLARYDAALIELEEKGILGGKKEP